MKKICSYNFKSKIATFETLIKEKGLELNIKLY